MGGDPSKIRLPTKGSDQDPADFFVEQIMRSETERAFIEELISDQALPKSANVNEDDLARRWSEPCTLTHSSAASKHNRPTTVPTAAVQQSVNKRISSSEKIVKGPHHPNPIERAHYPVIGSTKLWISQPQRKRNYIDKREVCIHTCIQSTAIDLHAFELHEQGMH
jgi:hypothetical protein